MVSLLSDGLFKLLINFIR